LFHALVDLTLVVALQQIVHVRDTLLQALAAIPDGFPVGAILASEALRTVAPAPWSGEQQAQIAALLRQASFFGGQDNAPALAAADLGIAMGAAGSDAALETADIALMGDDLSKIPFTVRLSRRALFNIKTNVSLSIGLKAPFLALAISGHATLWMAIAADTGASLLVIANGLRLLRTA
jgi:hypothetical protein